MERDERQDIILRHLPGQFIKQRVWWALESRKKPRVLKISLGYFSLLSRARYLLSLEHRWNPLSSFERMGHSLFRMLKNKELEGWPGGGGAVVVQAQGAESGFPVPVQKSDAEVCARNLSFREEKTDWQPFLDKTVSFRFTGDLISKIKRQN